MFFYQQQYLIIKYFDVPWKVFYICLPITHTAHPPGAPAFRYDFSIKVFIIILEKEASKSFVGNYFYIRLGHDLGGERERVWCWKMKNFPVHLQHFLYHIDWLRFIRRQPFGGGLAVHSSIFRKSYFHPRNSFCSSVMGLLWHERNSTFLFKWIPQLGMTLSN